MNISGKWFVIFLVAFALGFLALEFWVIKKVKSHPEKHLELNQLVPKERLDELVKGHFKIG